MCGRGPQKIPAVIAPNSNTGAFTKNTPGDAFQIATHPIIAHTDTYRPNPSAPEPSAGLPLPPLNRYTPANTTSPSHEYCNTGRPRTLHVKPSIPIHGLPESQKLFPLAICHQTSTSLGGRNVI